MSESTIEGVDEVIAMFERLEAFPSSLIDNTAKKGATMALKYVLANLQPANGSFLGRQGRNLEWGRYDGGNLKRYLKLKKEKTPNGKTVYKVLGTWYSHFKDLGFTTRDGKKVDGSHFMKEVQTQHYDEIQAAMIDELSKGINKITGNA